VRDTDFAYASTYARTLENKMLDKADFEALLGAPSAEHALKYLSDKGYGGGKKGESGSADALLKGELAYIWDEVKDVCPKGASIDVLLYQNDFHNLKTILKSVFSGAAYEPLMLEPCTAEPGAVHSAVTEGSTDVLPELLKNPAEEAYRVLARDEDGQLAEIILDKALYSAMNVAARRSKSDFLADWVDLNIAVMNMKIALRGVRGGKSAAFLRDAMLGCKRINADTLASAAAQDVAAVVQVFAQSGFADAADAAGSINIFEKWCDDLLLRYARAAGEKLFGFETVFSFFICKQFELRAVRVILSGLRSGIPSDALRERLGDLY